MKLSILLIMSNFSLQYQYIVKQTGDENKENHQLRDARTCTLHPCILEASTQDNIINMFLYPKKCMVTVMTYMYH